MNSSSAKPKKGKNVFNVTLLFRLFVVQWIAIHISKHFYELEK